VKLSVCATWTWETAAYAYKALKQAGIRAANHSMHYASALFPAKNTLQRAAAA